MTDPKEQKVIRDAASYQSVVMQCAEKFLVQDDAGDWIFWPGSKDGAWSQASLQIVLDELSRRNGIEPLRPDDVYDSVLRKWRNSGNRPLKMGKHEASNAKSCESVIESLLDAGMDREASWAAWMLWWRWMDREQRKAELEVLKERVQEAIDFAGGHESEWGERAEHCFEMLEQIVSA